MCWLYLLLTASCLQLAYSQNPVNGVWSSWSETEICDVDCGQGFNVRVRTCDNPPPQNGGANCSGSSTRPVNTCTVLCGCELEPCANNGSCVQSETDDMDYNCVCTSGFYGQNCTSECGEEINLTEASLLDLTSVGYPDTYPDNIHCTWTIFADPGLNIQLTFNKFDVDHSAAIDCLSDYSDNVKSYASYDFFSDEDIVRFCPCIYDLVIIYSLQDTSPADEVYVLCNGNQPTNIITIENNQMSLVFHTDPGFAGQNRHGFNISVTAVPVTPDATASPCSNHLCTNNATCKAQEMDYFCDCPQGYSGTFCDTDSSASTSLISSWILLLSAFGAKYALGTRDNSWEQMS